MQNMMNMGTIMPNMIPGMAPPLLPPYMIGDVSQITQMGPPMGQMTGVPMNQLPPINHTVPPFNQLGDRINNAQQAVIIPPLPGNQETGSQSVMPDADNDGQGNEEMHIVQPDQHSQPARERNDRRDRDYDRERTERRRRSRSRNRDRSNRGDRGDRNRHDFREKHSKWDNNDKHDVSQKPPNTLIQNPPPVMQYGNLMTNQMANPLISQHMDMTHMMQGPDMNMMQNMMMMNSQMPNQPVYFSLGVILPPLPNHSTPIRRERPNGCRTIFVGGIPQGTSEDIIMEIFQRFGSIDEVKIHKGVCHVRFEKPEAIDMAFTLSGYRVKRHDQSENEATTLFIDYAQNRDDQCEYEKNKRNREVTPPRIEPYTAATLSIISEKIKSDTDFTEAAPTLTTWLERGECNKKNSNTFYSLIQSSNNQLRRLFNEKMQIDEEYQTLKNTIKDKFAHILLQFEQVAKILTAAKHQRVSDHFSKQQRRNIEMWLKMTEELDNIKEEFRTIYEDDETERGSKNVVSMEKYEQLRVENENLLYELEGYKNEAHLAKDEAERKFEKFKAHFIAQQALQQKQIYPPLPSSPMPNFSSKSSTKLKPPPPPPEETISIPLLASEAKLISLMSAFLMVHPRGVSLDYLVSYVKSMVPSATQTAVHNVLNKFKDVFCKKTTGVGACIEHKWCFATFDSA